MSLAQRLSRQIGQDGPISVAQYMNVCLLDPADGYYPSRDPIGAGADFITAPEISQMFGELIGVWLAQNWQNIGQPSPVHLAELGPGKGTMMSDVLRAAQIVPGFADALHVHLIEASAALTAVQAKTLAPFAQPIHWAETVTDTGTGPLLLIANEYLDCLAVRQFIRGKDHWFERMVDCNTQGEFCYVQGQSPLGPADIELIPPPLRQSPVDTLLEVRPAIDELFSHLQMRAKTAPVLALFIDYGPKQSEPGDTVQAICAHQKVDPLTQPGQVDITARVDFAALSRAATAADLIPTEIYTQGQWLQQLGLMERAAALCTHGKEDRAKIARQIHRLTDPSEMGDLFKVMAVSSASITPVGF